MGDTLELKARCVKWVPPHPLHVYIILEFEACTEACGVW